MYFILSGGGCNWKNHANEIGFVLRICKKSKVCNSYVSDDIFIV